MRFVKGCTVPARHVHKLGETDDQGMVLIMPAWQTGSYLGIKTVTIFPRNGEQFGKPGIHSTYMLYDARNGEPLAHMDGDEITSRRTAAVSALAASFLAKEHCENLLIVGAGRVAYLLAKAMSTVRPTLKKIRVWNRNHKKAEDLAKKLCGQGFDAQATEDLEHSVMDSCIVSCATLAAAPLIQASWLMPGVHLDLIGSFTPSMSEAEPACFRKAQVYCDTLEGLAKSGDFLNAIGTGNFKESDLKGTIADLCKGAAKGRRNHQEVTLFKSVGIALADFAAAELVYRRHMV